MNALERLLARPPAQTSVTVPYDPAAAHELARARIALLAASSDHEVAARAHVESLEAQLVTVRFDLVGVGSRRVQQLQAAHPAKKKFLPDGTPATVDHDGFTAQLLSETIAAVTFSDAPEESLPGLTVDQVHELLGRLSVDDQVALHVEALRLDQVSTIIEDAGT